jgi:flavin-dependent dehydrogenase
LISLDLGGFGISRYTYDHFLFDRLPKNRVEVKQNTEVMDISFENNQFLVETSQSSLAVDVVIAASGKRSKLDATLQRPFLNQRSPYVGIKYHIQCDHPDDLISLHNFKDGYCGLSNIEDGKSNLCYLTHRTNLKKHGSIEAMEKEVLFRNPYLRSIFTESKFLFEKPEVINEISFATKAPVENHILMGGDAAGMITPLCGNGMAMAIHSSKLLAEQVAAYCFGEIDRTVMEQRYEQNWKKQFAKRLWAGRNIQKLFGSETASNIAVNLARHVKPVANFLISKTHGQPF